MEDDLSELILNSPHQLQAWFQTLDEQIASIEGRYSDYQARFQSLFPSHPPPLQITPPADPTPTESPKLSPIHLTRKDFIKSNIDAAKWPRRRGSKNQRSISPTLDYLHRKLYSRSCRGRSPVVRRARGLEMARPNAPTQALRSSLEVTLKKKLRRMVSTRNEKGCTGSSSTLVIARSSFSGSLSVGCLQTRSCL